VNRTSRHSTADIRSFRDALGEFATGVVIVTAATPEGDRIGVTVSSFNSVSLSPPLVLFSIARSAYSLATFVNAKKFAVNVLHAGQQEVSNRFARALESKWSGLDWPIGMNGSPIAPDHLALFECESYAHYDGGDHVIVVGYVTRFVKNGGRDPLLFFRGAYHKLLDSNVAAASRCG
jgi:flavin reductase (DIM6/NTAB) family NADH-FMN oxidoreductase RutF